jgi:hypothetical protein
VGLRSDLSRKLKSEMLVLARYRTLGSEYVQVESQATGYRSAFCRTCPIALFDL